MPDKPIRKYFHEQDLGPALKIFPEFIEKELKLEKLDNHRYYDIKSDTIFWYIPLRAPTCNYDRGSVFLIGSRPVVLAGATGCTRVIKISDRNFASRLFSEHPYSHLKVCLARTEAMATAIGYIFDNELLTDDKEFCLVRPGEYFSNAILVYAPDKGPVYRKRRPRGIPHLTFRPYINALNYFSRKDLEWT